MNAHEPARRIFAGVDGSSGSIAALRWAWKEAQLRGIGLDVVACWQYPVGPAIAPPPVSAHDLEQVVRQEAEAAIQAVVGSERTAADVVLTVLEGSPSLRLLDLGATAEMIVVGSRGRGGFAGLLLGSVSQHLAQHAPCPVVIVHSASE